MPLQPHEYQDVIRKHCLQARQVLLGRSVPGLGPRPPHGLVKMEKSLEWKLASNPRGCTVFRLRIFLCPLPSPSPSLAAFASPYVPCPSAPTPGLPLPFQKSLITIHCEGTPPIPLLRDPQGLTGQCIWMARVQVAQVYSLQGPRFDGLWSLRRFFFLCKCMQDHVQSQRISLM